MIDEDSGLKAFSIENSVHLGKAWAALRDDVVISVVSMLVPNDVDFEDFRIKSIAALEVLGTTKAGDLYSFEKDTYFVARPHKHQNRNKNKERVPIKPLKLSPSLKGSLT